ncbi:hypothetical protein F511_24503 [Dorcoceras hygrometricum]|uniref:Uncharacterized protein n=1 Tax=Dorcoceras hygrometricum TaxID=472368 RepID=A0A2Z7AQ36_9LAMI|nr:hypothetical protein F511_24503 [Dorcoceras hygrometricum]
MASALISNILHISFDSVLAMDDAGLVAVFEALVATGLKEFLGTIRGMTVEISENVFAGAFQRPMDGLTDLSEVPKDLVFDARNIVSDSGKQVSTSCKKREMKIEFHLLSDILAKTIFVKAGSFDAVTHERFLLMTAIISDVKINWSRLLFDILKDMATPGSRQAKGFAIQICVLLKNVPGLELGDFKSFPSPRILMEKTVHRYVVINEKVSGEEVADEPRVKKTPIKRAASKKRPAVAAAEPVVKRKRTTKGKSVSSKENLEILPVAQEAVPLQIIEPTSAATVEQPPVPKRKSKKRRLRLPKGSDDENVETPVTIERAETAVDISEEETVSVFEKSEPTVANVPVSESTTEEVISTSADDVDIIIEQVIAETAQMGADEVEIDIGGATVSGPAVGSQAVEKADDGTDEEIETIDVGTGVGEQQLQTFDTTDNRTDASADYTMTEPVEEMEMAAVEQSTDEAIWESLFLSQGSMKETGTRPPKIPATDKGKALLQERDPVNGNPVQEQFSLIVSDVDLLVQLREQIIDEVDKFFNSFSLKKLAARQTDDISAKEELVLSWAEAESTRVDINRKTYILTKYRELLIRKFLEAHRANFVPGDGSSAVDLKILDKLSSLHLFLVEELKKEVQAHGLMWDRMCCSQIFEGRPRDRGAVIARTNSNTRSTYWIRTMILVDGVWVVEPCGDHWVKIPQRIVNNEILRQRSYDDTLPPITTANWFYPDIRNFVSSIAEDKSALRVVQSVNRSDDSSLHFDDTDAAVTSLFLPTTAPDVTDALAQIRTSIDQIRVEQIRRKDDVDKLRDTLLMHIHDIEKKFLERFDAHDRTYRVLLNNIRHDARDHKKILSLDLKSSQQKLSTQVASAAFDTVDVRKEVKDLNAKVTFLDGQVAAIRSELFDFRAKPKENHLNLSTQLGFLVDYINRGGDAKKGEGGSSRPQPPPDDQS